ncbi:polysaccharide deacetylase [Legionella waltersii]|uniref:Polysaccharide deacetylase n=2 Tax=Legionella waltersii TaxID=66969 RepID=A0A0W1A7B2_9GAMM|nr:polysaccharide deacetylase [Legionella waltersii]SNV11334.1 polysaccharide deacetylase [Legionella waltersii]
MVGYGKETPPFSWPNKAKIAINFVINYEEGSEQSPVNGDEYAEVYGTDFPFSKKPKGKRSLSVESSFEYGSRVGIWRLIRLFDQYSIPLTFFVCGQALILNPALADYLASSDHEVAGHGWRWLDYSTIPAKTEKEHIHLCVETLEKLTGKKIQGWYTGRRSEHTRSLLEQAGGFLYDSDSYADELPYKEKKHLIIPYSLDNNDFRYTTSPGFTGPSDFYEQLVNTFKFLHAEQRLALMSIGLHPRLSGKPAKAMVIKQFLDYLSEYKDVWIARRVDVAKYWLER